MNVTLILATCVGLFWTPALNATSHDIFLGRTVIGDTPTHSVRICRGNLPYYTEVNYRVVGKRLRVDNSAWFYGPHSGSLTVKWVWDFDYDDDEIVGFSDYFVFAQDFGKNVPRSDADGDGVVGFSDFGLFAQSFGECNNGVRVVDCG